MDLAQHDVRLTGPAEAQAMVLAHGFGCDQSMWRYVAPQFADEYRVVLFDHVGAGGADPAAYDPVRHADLAGYADDVIALLDELSLGPVVFVGHSVSAMIGVLAEGRRPDLFDRLVLVGPSPRYVDAPGYRGGFSADEIDELLATMDENYLGWSSVMAPVIMGNAERPELGAELTEAFCRTDPAIARRFARTTFLSDNRADLAGVRAPSLVVQCREDVIAPVEVGRFVHDQLPDSTFALIDAVGHCPNLSAPDELVGAMRQFLGP
ncbi:alpha/beta hydrolase [Oerskovia flava]|uniref:alpha/beta fold hydrolase n=1 Tax=Oerskovia flava TaxID=2986422 RepID=UPI002AD54D23|nr:alpha/beta hydrolase [Oerskovia sp. JB1-3-2]